MIRTLAELPEADRDAFTIRRHVLEVGTWPDSLLAVVTEVEEDSAITSAARAERARRIRLDT